MRISALQIKAYAMQGSMNTGPQYGGLPNLGGPYNRDSSIWGSILQSPMLGTYQIEPST